MPLSNKENIAGLESGKTDAQQTLVLSENEYMPNVSVSCVILSFDEGCIKILLCKLKEDCSWTIPNSLVKKAENLNDSAKRIVKEKAGVADGYIRQFHFFDSNSNEPCSAEHYIRLAYYSLIKYEDAELRSFDFEELEWFDINDTPHMYPEYEETFRTAIATIRTLVGFIPIGFELLSPKFTMPELRSIYESILNRELDRRNFQRKMLSIGFIKPLNETRKVGAHKSPNLYSFIEDRYREAEESGSQIMSNNL
ncbi:NUDIX domain-containing protein [Dysgonomonas sp. 511]|uniref:NUDIX hydrolase n=1 Tax=Dysgonomonas sp. 511 TaxID=2302930 RepID=UPI0013D32655|nr:NUDIX domain-containing protein [Dysgonomonas sp. 511]NDV79037.1 NUDIX domain-containing protein [Dysgonomonas sp. 511]